MKYLFIFLFFIITGLVVSQVVVSKSTSNTKNIEYITLKKYDRFEIRKYNAKTVAITNLANSSFKEMSRNGFRRIASYIFGGNASNQQIAMTAPVKMDMGPSSSMSFYMPENYSISSLPEPNRKDVILTTEPAKIVAVIQFSGWANNSILNSKFEELKSFLEDENISFNNEYSYLGYNPPYQLVNRKNEVIITLKDYRLKE